MGYSVVDADGVEGSDVECVELTGARGEVAV